MSIFCFDGGGSKCRALLADDDYNLVGDGFSYGVNTSHTPWDDATRNIDDCLRQTLGEDPPQIDTAYITIVGPFDYIGKKLSPYAKRIERIGEPQSALLAGALERSGYVALAGTGSDVFQLDLNSERINTLGGWGLLLGDDGSGAWIGQQALRSVVRDMARYGESTTMTNAAIELYGTDRIFGIVDKMYHSPSYARFFGAFVPHAAKCASDGDTVALRIFAEAGRHMANQMRALYKRSASNDFTHYLQDDGAPEVPDVCVLIGGAWKAHPKMYETFRDELAIDTPLEVIKPQFEPVMAGVVKALLARFSNKDELLAYLKERFGKFIVGT